MATFLAALLLLLTPAPPQAGPARNAGRGESRAAAAQDCGPVYRMSEVDVKPRIRSKPNPGYTERARRAGVSGRVEVAAVLCGTGEVGDVEVIRGLPEGLSEEAVKAARRIRFEPARKDDERVAVRVRVLYDFQVF